jgi:hypothetical protein
MLASLSKPNNCDHDRCRLRLVLAVAFASSIATLSLQPALAAIKLKSLLIDGARMKMFKSES